MNMTNGHIPHIGFSGTRDGMTARQAWHLHTMLSRRGKFIFHHGDCVGADAQAHEIVAGPVHMPVVIHPPRDGKLRAHCAGAVKVHPPRAYLARNRDIVEHCELLIACPKQNEEQEKGGTWYTVRYARQLYLPVIVLWPDGRTS